MLHVVLQHKNTIKEDNLPEIYSKLTYLLRHSLIRRLSNSGRIVELQTFNTRI